MIETRKLWAIEIVTKRGRQPFCFATAFTASFALPDGGKRAAPWVAPFILFRTRKLAREMCRLIADDDRRRRWPKWTYRPVRVVETVRTVK